MIPCLYASTEAKFDHNGIGKPIRCLFGQMKAAQRSRLLSVMR